jgi:hypothetical protein
MSRRSSRNRHRQPAVKARQSGPPPVTFTGAQVQALMAAGAVTGQQAVPLPRPPAWSQVPFAPGQPLIPSPVNRPRPQTGRAEPRLFELPISTNLNIATAPYVPWRILTEAADVPLFRKCIQRRKGICSLGFEVTLDPKAVAREAALSGQADKDVEKAMRKQYLPDVIRISDWLERPDRGNGHDWRAWTGLLMENRLVYDATVVYPLYSFGGELLSFEVPDGSTFKPLLNERGGRPLPPAPHVQQILYGYPRGEFTADTELGADGQPWIPGGFSSDEVVYERTVIRPKTPYGMSDTEIAILDGILWMRRMGWLLGEYTQGVSGSMLETSSEVDWDVNQWGVWLAELNDKLSGDTAARLQWSLLPPGTKAVLSPEVAERYKPEMDMFLVKLIAGDFGLTATELGFPEVGSLGASFHEGEEDVLNRVTRIPDADWVGGLATRLCARHLGMPAQLQVRILGLESEDEAAADATALAQVQSGRMTLNQDRERRGEPPYDFPEADMPMLMTARGVVFLEGASTSAPPGTLVGPAMAPPASAPPGGDLGQGSGGEQGQEDGGEQEPAPGQKQAEARALKSWLARHPEPARPFVCKALTAADAPALADDARVVFKAGDDEDPKVPAGRGLAGTGTRTS